MSRYSEVLASNQLYTPDGKSGFLIQIYAITDTQGRGFLLVKSKFTSRSVHVVSDTRFPAYGDAKRAQVEEYHKMVGQGLKERRPIDALVRTG